jgi:hypothetical protein
LAPDIKLEDARCAGAAHAAAPIFNYSHLAAPPIPKPLEGGLSEQGFSSQGFSSQGFSEQDFSEQP